MKDLQKVYLWTNRGIYKIARKHCICMKQGNDTTYINSNEAGLWILQSQLRLHKRELFQHLSNFHIKVLSKYPHLKIIFLGNGLWN